MVEIDSTIEDIGSIRPPAILWNSRKAEQEPSKLLSEHRCGADQIPFKGQVSKAN